MGQRSSKSITVFGEEQVDSNNFFDNNNRLLSMPSALWDNEHGWFRLCTPWIGIDLFEAIATENPTLRAACKKLNDAMSNPEITDYEPYRQSVREAIQAALRDYCKTINGKIKSLKERMVDYFAAKERNETAWDQDLTKIKNSGGPEPDSCRFADRF